MKNFIKFRSPIFRLVMVSSSPTSLYFGRREAASLYEGYTKGTQRVYQGYTRGIQGISIGYTRGIQGFIGYSQDIISSLT